MNGTRYKKRKGSWLIRAGLVLIAAALLLTVYNIWIQLRAYRVSEAILGELRQQIGKDAEIPDYLMNPDMEMPVIIINGRAYVGTLEIPDIDAELPVISEWSYENLAVAPCRYSGTPYLGNFVIAAHNYSSHFGGLRRLATGSRVIFTDAAGNVFSYEVKEVEVLQPDAVREMRESDYPLTLFTCTLGGAARMTVRCERIL